MAAGRVRQPLRRDVLRGQWLAIVVLALALQFPLKYVWSPQTYQATHHIRVIDAAIGKVPEGATIETSLNELAPLAARDDTYWIGNENPAPQWILFDQRSPEWSVANVPAFIQSKHAGLTYRVVSTADGVWVFHRIAPADYRTRSAQPGS